MNGTEGGPPLSVFPTVKRQKMEISHVLARSSELTGMSAAQSKTGMPQAPAAAAPTAPANGVRVTAPESAKKATISETEIKHALEEINRFITPVNGNI